MKTIKAILNTIAMILDGITRDGIEPSPVDEKKK